MCSTAVGGGGGVEAVVRAAALGSLPCALHARLCCLPHRPATASPPTACPPHQVREYGSQRWLVLINHNEDPATIQLPAAKGGGGEFSWAGAVDLLTGYVIQADPCGEAGDAGAGADASGGGGQQGFASIALAAQGVVVLHQTD